VKNRHGEVQKRSYVMVGDGVKIHLVGCSTVTQAVEAHTPIIRMTQAAAAQTMANDRAVQPCARCRPPALRVVR
jgi:hypothetical protein